MSSLNPKKPAFIPQAIGNKSKRPEVEKKIEKKSRVDSAVAEPANFLPSLSQFSTVAEPVSQLDVENPVNLDINQIPREPLFKLSFEVDAAEAVAFGLKHKKVFGGDGFTPLQPRSSEQIINEGADLLARAAEGIVYGWHSNPALITPEEDITVIQAIADIEDQTLKGAIVKALERDLGKSFVTYLGSRGPFNHQRFWLRVGDLVFQKVDEGKNAYLVVAFPEIVANGNHGSIVAAFCESISNYLAAGGESSIVNFVEASGQTVHPSVRRFAFAKAVHCSAFPKEERKLLKADMDLIFDEMIGAKGSGDLGGLKFLNKELIEYA